VFLACIAGLVLASPLLAQEAPQPAEASVDVIVLPFANYTGRYEALEAVLPVFYSLLEIGGLRLMSHEELRPILRKHRTRVVGSIDTRAMRVLQEETGARVAIVGSVDVYEPETSLEVLISARVVELQSGRVLTAVSLGRTVQETERVFGRGRASEIDEIVDSVVQEFLGEIRPYLDTRIAPETRDHRCSLVAVVPLDDYSSRRHGAKVLENLLIAELVQRGWSVTEPGAVREALLAHETTARGGVSDEVSKIFAEELGACYVITGEVEEFSLAAAGQAGAVPHLEYGLRVIDARTASLVDAADQIRDGLDGETFLGRGREYSMARLARTSVCDLLDELDLEGDRR